MRIVRHFFVLSIVVFMMAAIVPVVAGELGACNARKAADFRAAGDRFRELGQFGDAARWYLAATKYTRDCRTDSGALLNARSLALAGTALAQNGDYLNALSLLHTAQSRLASLAAFDPHTADTARSFSEIVQTAITAIDRVAEASM